MININKNIFAILSILITVLALALLSYLLFKLIQKPYRVGNTWSFYYGLFVVFGIAVIGELSAIVAMINDKEKQKKIFYIPTLIINSLLIIPFLFLFLSIGSETSRTFIAFVLKRFF